MTFGWPQLLWALLLVPVALFAYISFQRRRGAYAQRFAAPAMMPNVAPSTPGWWRHLPLMLYLLAVVALVAGLARPYALMAVPRQRATVILVMDSSRSMQATDVEPDRLSAARTAARAFIDEVPRGFEVGVVGFTRRPYVLSRPSTDHVAVRRALGDLRHGLGTAIGNGMRAALEIAAPPEDRTRSRNLPVVFVLLSDGNNTAGSDPLTVAQELQEARVRVYTIALGDPDQVFPQGPPPPDLGQLERIAETTGGTFFDAPSAARLRAIYGDIGTILAVRREPQEITAAFVGAGFLLLLAGAGLSALWFKRVA